MEKKYMHPEFSSTMTEGRHGLSHSANTPLTMLSYKILS